jgi:sec-independent protein translocase protein TatA
MVMRRPGRAGAAERPAFSHPLHEFPPMTSLFAYIFSGPEWLIVLIVVLLLFGNRLPSVMRSLGKGVTEFKKGIEGIEDDVDSTAKKSEPKKVDEEQPKKVDEASPKT